MTCMEETPIKQDSKEDSTRNESFYACISILQNENSPKVKSKPPIPQKPAFLTIKRNASSTDIINPYAKQNNENIDSALTKSECDEDVYTTMSQCYSPKPNGKTIEPEKYKDEPIYCELSPNINNVLNRIHPSSVLNKPPPLPPPRKSLGDFECFNQSDDRLPSSYHEPSNPYELVADGEVRNISTYLHRNLSRDSIVKSPTIDNLDSRSNASSSDSDSDYDNIDTVPEILQRPPLRTNTHTVRTENKSLYVSSNSKSIVENVAEEVLFTERRYLKYLDFLEKVYDNAMKSSPHHETEIKSIFKDIASLKQLHELLENKLAVLIDSGLHSQLYSVFLDPEIIFSLKMYKPFFQSFKVNSSSLSSLIESDSNFAQCCHEIRMLTDEEFGDVTKCYTKVIGRPFELQNLLERFSKEVKKDKLMIAAIAPADEAYEKMKELLRSFDLEKKNLELFNEALQKFNLLENSKRTLQNSTVFIREGPVTKISSRRAARRRLRHLFLFSDCLYVTYPINSLGRYPVSASINVDGIIQISAIDEENVENAKYSFCLNAVNINIDLVFESEAEMKDWVESILDSKNKRNENITSTLPSSEHLAPIWIKDELVSQCMRCCAKFAVLPISRRKHHCRACGYVICDKCSQRRMEIPCLENKVKRVCDFCYISWNPEEKHVLPKPSVKNKRDKETVLINGKIKYEIYSAEHGWSSPKPCFCIFTRPGFVYINKCKEDIQPIFKALIISFEVKTDDNDPLRVELHHQSNVNLKYALILNSERLKWTWIEKFEEVCTYYHQ